MVSTLLLRSDLGMVELLISFDTRIIRPASLPFGPVVTVGGQYAEYQST